MNDAALFELAQGTALNGLDRVAHLTDVIGRQDDPNALLASRLHEGMFACDVQLVIAIGFANRMVLPMIGRAVPELPDVTTIGELRGLCTQVRGQLAALSVSDFEGAAGQEVTHQAGQGQLTQTSRDYLVDFAIPNFWFHLSMVYAVLRHHGVPVGKGGFDGLHDYAPGFSFI